jgi:hypothetical protein
MDRMKNWLKKPEVRQSAEAGLNSSAAMPNSGLDSADNSRATSAAASELSAGLDFVLNDWDPQSRSTAWLSNTTGADTVAFAQLNSMTMLNSIFSS